MLINEIKMRISIVELAMKFGLEPNKQLFIKSIYKEEKHPSLKLYPKTNSYYDFSSGKGGDVINFYADFNRIELEEAIKILSKELGLESFQIVTRKDLPTVTKKPLYHFTLIKSEDVYFDSMELELAKMNDKDRADTEQIIYRDILHHRVQLQKMVYESFRKYCGEISEEAKKYLTGPERGLSLDTISHFGIFSVNDVKAVLEKLRNDFSDDDLKIAGLINETANPIFFKHQIAIPYYENGEIVYLRFRYFNNGSADCGDSPKYIGLNNWSTNLTAKRLFNKDVLKDLTDDSQLLIAEGEFDCMIASQFGFKTVGIPGVNNFPDHESEALRKFDIYICLDRDAAGAKGMYDVSNKIGKHTNGIFLKEHKDLTELLTDQKAINLLDNQFSEIKKIEYVIKKKSTLRLISAAELQGKEIPPINWVVKGLLPEGLAYLAGRPKIGKSWMAKNIAISVANGTMALGTFATNRADVLYCALEDNQRRIKDRINNIMRAELYKKAPDNLYYLQDNWDFPKLNNGGIEEIEKTIEDNPNIKLIIIDTLGRSIADKKRMDKNIYQADYDFSSRIQETAMKFRVCILLLHHTKKQGEENVFDEISGTTGFTGAADTMMVIKKKNGKYYLHVTGRDLSESEYEIEFSDTLFTWNVIQKNDDRHLTAEREEIIQLLTDYNRPMRTGEIAELLGKEKSNTSKLLKKLVEDGHLESPKFGHYQLKVKKPPEQAESGDFFN